MDVLGVVRDSDVHQHHLGTQIVGHSISAFTVVKTKEKKHVESYTHSF